MAFLSVPTVSLYATLRGLPRHYVPDTVPCTRCTMGSPRSAFSSRAVLPGRVRTVRYLYRCRYASGRVVRAESNVTREPMVPPYNVLITGSSKGIGYALAKKFLKAGNKVVICSRSADRVELAVESLRKEFGEQHVEQFVMLEKERM